MEIKELGFEHHFYFKQILVKYTRTHTSLTKIDDYIEGYRKLYNLKNLE